MGEEQLAANYTREMEFRPYWKTRWLMIALLMLPTLVWCGYSLLHPNTKKNGDKLYRLIEVPVHAEQTSPWVMQESGTKAGLRGIDSVDGKIAWASGTGGTVLKTIDGGEHWQKCAVPDGDKDGATLDFRGVQAWDATTAIVMASGPGDKSRLYKTADGCKSWTEIVRNHEKDGFWDAFNMNGPNVIFGDPVGGYFTILSSSDDGKTWTSVREPGLESNEKEGAFAASNSSLYWEAIDDIVVLASGGPSGARVLFHCEDCTKRKWIAVPVPVFARSQSAGIFSIYRGISSHWVAVGGDYVKPNESAGTAAFSKDGGKTWAAASKPPHGYRSSVQWNQDLKAWITVGTDGSDISRDDGKTWQPLDDGNWNALSLPFVVGPKGRIARLSQIPVK